MLKIDALHYNANHRVLGENPLIVIDGNGGGRRDRTDDIQLAKLALSQLSYAPIESAACVFGGSGWTRTNDPRLIKTVL